MASLILRRMHGALPRAAPWVTSGAALLIGCNLRRARPGRWRWCLGGRHVVSWRHDDALGGPRAACGGSDSVSGAGVARLVARRTNAAARRAWTTRAMWVFTGHATDLKITSPRLPSLVLSAPPRLPPSPSIKARALLLRSIPLATAQIQTMTVPPSPEPFRVFVGYDPKEHEAYEVCRRSLIRHATVPLDVRPIRQPDLRASGLYWRTRGHMESTEFSFTRFLTPFLAGYRGWALFIDCDFLYLADVAELIASAVPSDAAAAKRLAVVCVKHEYKPLEATKMDGAMQTVYPRKNWSSMVLYNCAHPKNVAALTPDAVSTKTGAFLHRFSWLDDDEIGEVPFVWNFLVGHNRVDPDDPATQPKALHYTCGGPWFDRYRDCEFADLWIKEAEELRAEKEKRRAEKERLELEDDEDDEGN
ncbi:protein CDI-like [Triticum dicoccoides]|uniref:protein CDI-like n=1 Tax=Triticum dicoccoides TaxID=85692 RepID=UPI00188EB0A1|nr:protein CDI-like [Triticum dicoccoides]